MKSISVYPKYQATAKSLIDWLIISSGYLIKLIQSAVRKSSTTASYPSLKLRNSMHYTYILLSSKSHIFYFGSTNNLKERFVLHNSVQVKSTKPHLPWKLVWYGAFSTEKEARDFELYLKNGSGKAFAYKRFVSEALKKDFLSGRQWSVALAKDTKPGSPEAEQVRFRAVKWALLYFTAQMFLRI